MIEEAKRYLSVPEVNADINMLNTILSVNIDAYDKVIIHGNYVGSKLKVEDASALYVLEQIIRFKSKNTEKVVLLIGNEDLQYIKWEDTKYRCPNPRVGNAFAIKSLYDQNKNLFKIAYQKSNYLFTHAGITDGWYRYHTKLINKFARKFAMDPEKEFGTILNRLYKTSDREILFSIPILKGGKEAGLGGPLWAEWSEFRAFESMEGFHQIVSHTPLKDFYTKDYGERTSITFIGCEKSGIKITEIHE